MNDGLLESWGYVSFEAPWSDRVKDYAQDPNSGS